MFTGSKICPFGITIRPLNPTRGVSYLDRSSFFKPSPLNKSRYIISSPFPWSTNTLFTTKPFIQAVTTNASSCGWVISRSSSLKAMDSRVYFSLFSEGCASRPSSTETTVSISFLRATKVPTEAAWMTSITPKRGGREFPLGQAPYPVS